MSRKKSSPNPGSNSSGVAQVVVSVAFAVMAAAGVGHNLVPSPRPPAVCAQVRVS